MNRLCREAGHSWLYVGNQTARYCRRENCSVAERFKDGRWESLKPLYRTYASVFTSSLSLWDSPSPKED
jgi:hypothetical protein